MLVRIPATDEAAWNFEAVGGAGYSDWDMDRYVLQASEQYEESCLKSDSVQMSRFAVPKIEEVKQARQARVPKKTQIDTRYYTRIWKTWSKCRNSMVENESVPEDVTMLNNKKLQYWLSLRSEKEVRLRIPSQHSPSHLLWFAMSFERYGRPEIAKMLLLLISVVL